MYKNSIFIHGHWWSHLHGKAKSFNKLFWTIAIPWDEDPFESTEYFKNNLKDWKNYVIIASSAWAISAIEIARKFDNISKLIFLNPAIHINTFNPRCKTKIFIWTQDGWISWLYNSSKNVEIIEIEWDHIFSWKEVEINTIIANELKVEI